MKPNPTLKPLLTISYKNLTLELTREGGGFIFLIFGIGLGAINTGNNLLYLILAMCCSFIAVSGILSELTLKKIQVEAHLSITIYAQESYPIKFIIRNIKKHLPSYSILVTLSKEWNGKCQIDRTGYFFYIPHGATQEKNVMFMAFHRGPLEISDCRLSTTFPFGFFIKTRIVPLKINTLVFPKIKTVELPLANQTSLEGEGIIKTRGEELYALREFKPGDSLNSVHWKSTAKTGIPRVKEFMSGGNQSYTVFLNYLDMQTNENIGPFLLEARVSETASLIYHLIRRGDEVSLKTQDYESPFGNSSAHLHSLMKYLAVVGLQGTQSKNDPLNKLASQSSGQPL